jgi:16S rRNA (cytosine967-C5)-methyltransferase
LTPREVALDVLMGRRGASRGDVFASIESGSDRALAESLVAGTTKWKGLIDRVLASHSDRPLSSLAPRVLWALRLGVCQFLIMGIPAHASVSTTVELLRRRGEKGFVNGVLRSAARHSGHVEIPSLDEDILEYATSRFSYPEWIARLFIERFGQADGLRLLEFGNGVPTITLRVNSLRTSRDYLLGRLRAQGVMAEPGPVPGSLTLLRGARVTSLPGFLEGEFVVQDPSAIVASLALGARPGEAVWDACAAPGGKTTHLAEMMEGSGTLVATDIDASRADMVRDTLGRMGLDFARVLARDASDPSLGGEPFSHGFDRILLDAPCSGLGVIRRNPDLRWNRRESDIPAMALRQTRLLESVKRYLRPGGVLVYSTCTLTKEENEDTWLRFLSRSADLVPLDPAAALDPGSAGMLSDEPFAGPGYRYILSHRSGSDGFFIARARRV